MRYEDSSKIRKQFDLIIKQPGVLDLNDIEIALKYIRLIGEDDEVAHGMEDNLRRRYLTDLSSHDDKAKLILTSDKDGNRKLFPEPTPKKRVLSYLKALKRFYE